MSSKKITPSDSSGSGDTPSERPVKPAEKTSFFKSAVPEQATKAPDQVVESRHLSLRRLRNDRWFRYFESKIFHKIDYEQTPNRLRKDRYIEKDELLYLRERAEAFLAKNKTLKRLILRGRSTKDKNELTIELFEDHMKTWIHDDFPSTTLKLYEYAESVLNIGLEDVKTCLDKNQEYNGAELLDREKYEKRKKDIESLLRKIPKKKEEMKGVIEPYSPYSYRSQLETLAKEILNVKLARDKAEQKYGSTWSGLKSYDKSIENIISLSKMQEEKLSQLESAKADDDETQQALAVVKQEAPATAQAQETESESTTQAEDDETQQAPVETPPAQPEKGTENKDESKTPQAQPETTKSDTGMFSRLFSFTEPLQTHNPTAGLCLIEDEVYDDDDEDEGSVNLQDYKDYIENLESEDLESTTRGPVDQAQETESEFTTTTRRAFETYKDYVASCQPPLAHPGEVLIEKASAAWSKRNQREFEAYKDYVDSGQAPLSPPRTERARRALWATTKPAARAALSYSQSLDKSYADGLISQKPDPEFKALPEQETSDEDDDLTQQPPEQEQSQGSVKLMMLILKLLTAGAPLLTEDEKNELIQSCEDLTCGDEFQKDRFERTRDSFYSQKKEMVDSFKCEVLPHIIQWVQPKASKITKLMQTERRYQIIRNKWKKGYDERRQPELPIFGITEEIHEQLDLLDFLERMYQETKQGPAEQPPEQAQEQPPEQAQEQPPEQAQEQPPEQTLVDITSDDDQTQQGPAEVKQVLQPVSLSAAANPFSDDGGSTTDQAPASDQTQEQTLVDITPTAPGTDTKDSDKDDDDINPASDDNKPAEPGKGPAVVKQETEVQTPQPEADGSTTPQAPQQEQTQVDQPSNKHAAMRTMILEMVNDVIETSVMDMDEHDCFELFVKNLHEELTVDFIDKLIGIATDTSTSDLTQQPQEPDQAPESKNAIRPADRATDIDFSMKHLAAYFGISYNDDITTPDQKDQEESIEDLFKLIKQELYSDDVWSDIPYDRDIESSLTELYEKLQLLQNRVPVSDERYKNFLCKLKNVYMRLKSYTLKDQLGFLAAKFLDHQENRLIKEAWVTEYDAEQSLVKHMLNWEKEDFKEEQLFKKLYEAAAEELEEKRAKLEKKDILNKYDKKRLAYYNKVLKHIEKKKKKKEYPDKVSRVTYAWIYSPIDNLSKLCDKVCQDHDGVQADEDDDDEDDDQTQQGPAEVKQEQAPESATKTAKPTTKTKTTKTKTTKTKTTKTKTPKPVSKADNQVVESTTPQAPQQEQAPESVTVDTTSDDDETPQAPAVVKQEAPATDQAPESESAQVQQAPVDITPTEPGKAIEDKDESITLEQTQIAQPSRETESYAKAAAAFEQRMQQGKQLDLSLAAQQEAAQVDITSDDDQTQQGPVDQAQVDQPSNKHVAMRTMIGQKITEVMQELRQHPDFRNDSYNLRIFAVKLHEELTVDFIDKLIGIATDRPLIPTATA